MRYEDIIIRRYFIKERYSRNLINPRYMERRCRRQEARPAERRRLSRESGDLCLS